MSFENDEMAYSLKSRQKLQHWFLLSCEIFLSSTRHSAHLLREHQVKEENTGLYSFPLKLKPARSPSMALCVQVCWCLNESEGTWRQGRVLSSNKRALQGISQKGEFIGVGVGQETPPRPSSDAPGTCRQPAWLPPVFSFLLTWAAAAAVRKSHSLTHTNWYIYKHLTKVHTSNTSELLVVYNF